MPLPVDLTPSSSSPPRAGMSESESGSPSRSHPPTFYKGDEYLARLCPGYTPMTEAQFNEEMKAMFPDATEETMHIHIAALNKQVEEFMTTGPGVRVVGMKPQPGDKTFFVHIPNSDYAIRMWDGGMEPYCQFCLDFYDTRRDVPVNLPKGFTLWPAPSNPLGMYTMSGPLVSWDVAIGGNNVPAGEEKWSVPQGMHITLVREGLPGQNFTFAVPVRSFAPVHLAQPQYGILSARAA